MQQVTASITAMLQAITTLGAVVILVPQHLHFLPRLVENINQSSPRFHDVVVVASGFPMLLKKKLKRVVRQINVPTRITFTSLGSAGRNRNAGSILSSAELVAFLDADDYYAPIRNSIALKLFAETKFDLLYHGFIPFENLQDLPSNIFPRETESVAGFVSSEHLFETTFPSGFRDRESELEGRAQSTNLIVPQEFGAFEIHHAHLICRTEVARSIRFHEIFGMRNEDGVFARDALERGLRIVCSPMVLSGYQQGARAKPKRRRHLTQKWTLFRKTRGREL